MKYIRRIEIHRFRSFSDESILTEEVNIYSGLNNSGKSNVLKALNLFFNNETSYDSPYDFIKDYNKAYTSQAGGAREIAITLHFNPQGEGVLRYPFNIQRKFRLDVGDAETVYASDNKEVQDLLDAGNGNVRRQFTRFLNSIKFFYVPAVRDKRFVRNLFLNFEKIVGDTSGDDLQDKLNELSDIISYRSEEISKDFESFLNLPTQAVLSSELTDILGSIQINVNSGLEVLRKNKLRSEPSVISPVPVDLFSSGDGVLMSYLAYFLAHLCRKAPNKRYIWGFEEPENSLEYSKVQKLANEFISKFSKYAQIFLTTHSPAFVSLREHKQVRFNRVYIEPNSDSTKPNKRLSRVKTLDQIDKLQLSLFGIEQRQNEYLLLRHELGMVEFAEEIKSAMDRVILSEKADKERVALLEEEVSVISRLFPDKILIIEDSNRQTLALWKALLGKSQMSDVAIYTSEGCATNHLERHLIILQQKRSGYSPRVFRQIDRDGMFQDQIEYIEHQHNHLVSGKFEYKIAVLPVYEIENFALRPDEVDPVVAEHGEDIREHFELTAKSKMGELARRYPGAPEGMFRHGYDYTPIVQKMRRGALADWRMYMPGKNIASKIANFNAARRLAALDQTSYPVELSSYLALMKTFFGVGGR